MEKNLYKHTVSQLMAHSNELNMLPGDGITDEMEIMLKGLLPYFDAKYTRDVQFKACATLFRTASKYAAIYDGNRDQMLMWQELEEMYTRKNADYGNSWEEELDTFGIICHYIRMYEKIKRVISVSNHGAMVKTESLVDTLEDICNYCVMTAMWLGVAGAERFGRVE